MSTNIDDQQLLKMLETGLGETAAAKQLGIPCHTVTDRVKKYLEQGILQFTGELEVVDWRAFGEWRRSLELSEAV